MKVLVPGHTYQLAPFEDGQPAQNVIQFIHKERKDPSSNELVTIANGTTNEEVLAVLINRLQYLQNRVACRENASAITKLEEALLWLEKRTSDRLKRQVEGTEKV